MGIKTYAKQTISNMPFTAKIKWFPYSALTISETIPAMKENYFKI